MKYNLNLEEYIALGLGGLLLVIIIAVVIWKMPKRLRRDKFATRWKALQERCPDKTQWAIAIIEADDLLDEALKKKRYKGKTMGERLVEAQKSFTANDLVWFGHKLRTKINENPKQPLRKQDVQKALFGLRQGLKDIGAL